MGSRPLLDELGCRLPMTAVHGYSITAPLRVHEACPELGPMTGVMDERFWWRSPAWAAGSGWRETQLGGRIDQHSDAAIQTCGRKVLDDWFPDVPSWVRCNSGGARPMMPDGLRSSGTSGLEEGVWLNLGHGSSGWAARVPDPPGCWPTNWLEGPHHRSTGTGPGEVAGA